VDVFERGAQQGAEPWIVINEQEAHRFPPESDAVDSSPIGN
jgi:hypothetical protein